jgi:anaerobic ribonucleoside-triphosphate reductase activating protein
MNILATQFTLEQSALEFYLSGCSGKPHCKNCHNPESWDFTKGLLWDSKYKRDIIEKVNSFDHMIKKIMIFGGEPFDQDINELYDFVRFLKVFGKEIWLFTRYDISEIPPYIKINCNYIKCGRYIEELTVDDNIQYGVKLATSNQKIYKKGVDYLNGVIII